MTNPIELVKATEWLEQQRPVTQDWESTEVCGHIDTLLSLSAELAEARQGERNMSEHARRVAQEANKAFEAASSLDDFWDACGYPGNRGTLTPAEQVASIIRERDAAEAKVTELSAEVDRLDPAPFRDALHDLVMLKAQMDIGCVPAPTAEQWAKAWAEAEELTRVEP